MGDFNLLLYKLKAIHTDKTISKEMENPSNIPLLGLLNQYTILQSAGQFS